MTICSISKHYDLLSVVGAFNVFTPYCSVILTDGMFADHNFYTSPYSGKITKFFENPLLS